MATSAEYDVNDTQLKTPIRMLLIGSSKSGKTEFLINLIKNAEVILDRKPDR